MDSRAIKAFGHVPSGAGRGVQSLNETQSCAQYFPGTSGNVKETFIFTSFPLFLAISMQALS